MRVSTVAKIVILSFGLSAVAFKSDAEIEARNLFENVDYQLQARAMKIRANGGTAGPSPSSPSPSPTGTLKPGDNCMTGSQCNTNICSPMSCVYPPQSAPENGFCNASSQCMTSDFCNANDRCKPKKDTGEKCQSSDQCISGLCNKASNPNACVAARSLANKQPCDMDAECVSGFCGNKSMKCRNTKDNGKKCNRDNVCTSHNCQFGSDGKGTCMA